MNFVKEIVRNSENYHSLHDFQESKKKEKIYMYVYLHLYISKTHKIHVKTYQLIRFAAAAHCRTNF